MPSRSRILRKESGKQPLRSDGDDHGTRSQRYGLEPEDLHNHMAHHRYWTYGRVERMASEKGQNTEGESKLTETALSVRIANVYNLLVRWQVAAVTDID